MESSRSSSGADPTDAEVLRLTRSVAGGDAEAFGLFYELWFDRAYALARRLTRRDESFCLDVVQDSMLRVVRSLRPMATYTELARWMSRVVRTTAIDILRREARRIRREERRLGRVSPREQEDAGALLEIEEAIAWIRLEIEKLPEDERALFERRFRGGSTLEAAGEALGISGNAAQGKLRRSIARIRAAARKAFG